jgi:pimeloyl-ACP methyl ester carboxylesterase
MKLAQRGLCFLLLLFCSGCYVDRATKVPMDAIYDITQQGGPERIMLVMLPGVRDRPEDLVQHGFVRDLRERGLTIDVVAVDAHLGYYLERSFIERLRDDIIAPARAKGYRRIWLMGISLGGMGSLLYIREHSADIDGVLLLAPFLGTQGTIAEVTRAGGLKHWQTVGIKPDDDERLLLAWLKNYQFNDFALPKIYLGYGKDDRFAPASLLLAEQLPPERVITIDGGHDWVTWIHLWKQLLDRDLFSSVGKTE